LNGTTQKLRCFICDIEIAINAYAYGELPPAVQDLIKGPEHIRRKREIEMEISKVPEGNISVIEHWKQFLND